jgi:retron-type reverse transcriptase
VKVLNAVYETDFLGFSYGFRPGRSAHRALDALAVGIQTKKVSWLLDADIRVAAHKAAYPAGASPVAAIDCLAA